MDELEEAVSGKSAGKDLLKVGGMSTKDAKEVNAISDARRKAWEAEQAKKAQVKPNSEPCPGPLGNACGQIGPDTKPNPNGSSAPAIKATEKEKGWWDSWGSGAVHLGLDVIGLIPVVGEVADGANAVIYLAEGDVVNAAISAAAMVPGLGMAATGAKLGTKAVGAVAEGALKKGGREAVEQVGKKEVAEEAAETAAEQGAKKADGKGGGNDKGKKKKKGPCDHLKKGSSSGKGDYRGGSYGGTKKSGIESHHAPANSTSPLPKSQGPAVQMEIPDHKGTSSHGHQGADGALYRAEIEELLKNGQWDEAMAMEIDDIQRVARESGDPEKYDEAIQEMREYYDCLKRHGLLVS